MMIPEIRSDLGLKRVCLCMIVRDEEKVLSRCLRSVLPWIDRWSIVDTGSVDSTAQLIERELQSLPGRIIHRPWVDFGTNRSEAIGYARADSDYLLIIDADDELLVDEGVTQAVFCQQLTKDAHRLLVLDKGLQYERLHLLSTRLPWRYEGVLHEYATCDEDFDDSLIQGMRYRRVGGGARSDVSAKYQRDTEVLKAALQKYPNHTRYSFYLAQSYRDAGQFEKAIDAYQHRATLGGWGEEVYYSLLQIAELLDVTQGPEDQVVGAYLKAHDVRPQRAEALTYLCGYLRRRQRWATAWIFAQEVIKISRPDDQLFLPEDVYQWRAVDEYAIAAYWIGKYGLAAQACHQLLKDGHLPAEQRVRVRENLQWAIDKLSPSQPQTLVDASPGPTPPDPPATEETIRCVAVLGPWRGGTSLVAGILQKLGASLGGPFYEANTGYPTYEDQDLRQACLSCHGELAHDWRRLTTPEHAVKLLRQWLESKGQTNRDNVKDSFLLAAKHPLLCLLVNELTTAWATRDGEAPLLISVHRPIEAIIRSWDRPERQGGAPWWPRGDRNKIVSELTTVRDVALQDRTHLLVDFEELRSKPKQAVTRIAEFCDFDGSRVDSAMSIVRDGR